MSAAAITWLGTGNFQAPPGRYWNGFVLEGEASGLSRTVLVELPPSTLANLRRAEVPLESIDLVTVSHFHPDHSFGWPFLLFELMAIGRSRPLAVLGPPGVAQFLDDMMRLGSLQEVSSQAHDALDISYLEAVDGAGVLAAGVPVTPVSVEHVPRLECFGYLFGLDGHSVAYSGDTRPCAGLDRLAAGSDTFVVECNGTHPAASHMDVESVRELAGRFTGTRFVATHLGGDVKAEMLPGIEVPEDFGRTKLPIASVT